MCLTVVFNLIILFNNIQGVHLIIKHGIISHPLLSISDQDISCIAERTVGLAD